MNLNKIANRTQLLHKFCNKNSKLQINLLYRNYHSTDHKESELFSDARKKILEKGLELVPKYGFTETTLLKAGRELNFSDSFRSVFKNGVYDLVKYHLQVERQRLKYSIEGKLVGKEDAKSLQSINNKEEIFRENIKNLCVERLKGNIPIIGKYQQALSVMFLPSNVPDSLHELSLLSDEIWWLSGYRTSDFDWYSKRASLAVVYTATELFMSQDNSPGFEDTFDFLTRRLNNSWEIGDTIYDVREWYWFNINATINVIKSQLARG